MPDPMPNHETQPNPDAQPATPEILNPDYNGLYGRLLITSTSPLEDAPRFLSPTYTIDPIPQITPLIERKYTHITQKLSNDERAKAWEGRDLTEAREEWENKFTAYVNSITNAKRLEALQIISGKQKQATEFTRKDTKDLYDTLCKGKSDTTIFVRAVAHNLAVGKADNKIGSQQIQDLISHFEWFASKFFGDKTAKAVSRMIELEASMNNNPQNTIDTLINNAATRRINDLREAESEILISLLPEAPEPAVAPPAPEAEPTEPEEDEVQTVTPISYEIEVGGKKVIIETCMAYFVDKNQDAYYMSSDGKTVAVFDDMGGLPAGEEASQIARDSIKNALEALPEDASEEQVKQALSEGYENAKQEIIKRETEDSRKHEMGTTASVARVYESEGQLNVTWLQMGDSRIYLVDENNQLSQISLDYSLVTKALADGRLTKAEADEINAKLDSVTDISTLEDKIKLWFDVREKMYVALSSNAIDPQLETKPLPLETKYVLVTSDGVHDNLTKEEIAEIFSSSPDVQTAVRNLVARALKRVIDPSDRNDRSKTDDITAAVIKISVQEPPADTGGQPTSEPTGATTEGTTQPSEEEPIFVTGIENEEELERKLKAIVGSRQGDQNIPVGLHIEDIPTFLKSILKGRLMGFDSVEAGDEDNVIIRGVQVEDRIVFRPPVRFDKVSVYNSSEGKLEAKVIEGDIGAAAGDMEGDLKKLNDTIVQLFETLVKKTYPKWGVNKVVLKGDKEHRYVRVEFIPEGESVKTTPEAAPEPPPEPGAFVPDQTTQDTSEPTST